MIRKVAVFHPGRQHSWQTVGALQQIGLLEWFATALLYNAERLPYRIERILPGQLRNRAQHYFRKITSSDIAPEAVRIIGAYEWIERILANQGWSRSAEIVNRLGNRRFQRGVCRLLRQEPAAVLWGYDTSCRDTFAFGRHHGMACVLDRTIGHPRALRQILKREREQAPEFFPNNIGMPTDRSIDEADQEIANADHIVVGSRFCADTMIQSGARPQQLHVIPYGYDESLFGGDRPDRPDLGALPVRFLFVGTVTPRKGVHHLFEAFRHIDKRQATLTVVGPLAIPSELAGRYSDIVDFRGALTRDQVAQEFKRAHCFIFPSLFEGGGIVLYEAIASGLGIIHSHATGDAVLPDGSNGIKLDEVSFESIKAAIDRILQEPEILRAWSDVSWSIRAENSWQIYRQRVGQFAASLLLSAS